MKCDLYIYIYIMVYQKSRKRYSRKRTSRKRTSRKRYSRKRYSRKRTSRKRTSRKRYSHKRKVQDGGSDTYSQLNPLFDDYSSLSEPLHLDVSSSDNQELSQDEMEGIWKTARTKCNELWTRFQIAGEQEDVIKEVMAFVGSPKNILSQEILENFITKLVAHIGTAASCNCVDNIVNKGLKGFFRRKISSKEKYNGDGDLNPKTLRVYYIVKYIMNLRKTDIIQRGQICQELLEIARRSFNKS